MHARQFELDVIDRSDVLARLLMLCHRRRCRVTAVAYAAGDRHRPARLLLSLEAQPRQMRRIGEWLLAPVDVIRVTALDAARVRDTHLHELVSEPSLVAS